MDTSTNITRIIALEEHFVTAAFLDGPGRWLKNRSDSKELLSKAVDLAAGRIADMDAAGIDIQVLSLNAPGVEQLESAESIKLARETNDFLSKAIEAYPKRFAGFASLATSAPSEAADELERVVRDYGFKGGLINGHARGRYLDDEFFWPILERAEALNVPLYLHPTRPTQTIIDAYYTGNFSENITRSLAMFGYGWHMETAIHVLRIILSGVFDRFPRLQMIIGHLGEALPFMLPRIESRFPREVTQLQRATAAYFRENLSYTFAGFNFLMPALNLLAEVGAERVMFSSDYPFGSMVEGRQFLEKLPVSPAEREKIAHGNAEAMLGF